MAGETVHTMSVTAAATSVYDLRFEGYSLTTTMAAPNEFYQSDTFAAGGHDWAVRYYPNYGHKDFVSLFLVLLSKTAEPVGATYTCVLLDRSGELSPTDEDYTSQVFTAGGGEESSWPISYIKEFLDDFLVGDCFVVRCTVTVLRKLMSSTGSNTVTGSHNSRHSDKVA